jgi:SNF2 family DNA or RNA helicase
MTSSTITLDVIDEKMMLFDKYLERSHMDKKAYQYDGVKWCLRNEIQPLGKVDPNPLLEKVKGGFIADEMGLGKTIMMIGTMVCNYLPRTLIVLPPVLMDQWYLQIYRTTGHKPLIYHGANKKKITIDVLRAATIVITTYGAITVSHKLRQQNVLTPLHSVRWQRIVFDEAHHLRNHTNSLYLSAK